MSKYLEEHLHASKDAFSIFPMFVVANQASRFWGAFANSFKAMLTVIGNSTSLLES